MTGRRGHPDVRGDNYARRHARQLFAAASDALMGSQFRDAVIAAELRVWAGRVTDRAWGGWLVIARAVTQVDDLAPPPPPPWPQVVEALRTCVALLGHPGPGVAAALADADAALAEWPGRVADMTEWAHRVAAQADPLLARCPDCGATRYEQCVTTGGRTRETHPSRVVDAGHAAIAAAVTAWGKPS